MELQQLFPQFDPELITHLEAVGQEVEFKEGAMLMRPGQYFKNSLIILDGRVKLYREGEEGRGVLLVLPGERKCMRPFDDLRYKK
jgi:CRP/FNR family transcriptional regulator